MTQPIAYPLGLGKLLLSVLLFSAAIMPHASAHLMVAQHGTINIVGNGAFLVLSLPVSAFDKVDDDSDNKLSKAELTKYRPSLIAQVNANVRLLEDGIARPLQGMLLSPVLLHDKPTEPASQLVVMGRFQLENIDNPLHFHLELFGEEPEAQQQKLSFSHPEKSMKHKVTLTPKQTEAELFPSLTANKLKIDEQRNQ